MCNKKSLILWIRKVFFLPPPQTKYFIASLLSALACSIPLAIRYAVKLVIVAQPSSNDSPLANEISKSFISKDLPKLFNSKLSITWFKINWSILPDLAIKPFLSKLFFEFFHHF